MKRRKVPPGTVCQGRILNVHKDPAVWECIAAAAGFYLAICPHGHVIRKWLCPSCRDGLSMMGAMCWECRQEGHDCPLSERVPAEIWPVPEPVNGKPAGRSRRQVVTTPSSILR